LVIVVDETAGAGDWIGNALYAIVETITDLWVFVREITVPSWTLDGRDGGLKIGSVSAVNAEGQVTTFVVRVLDFEEESIRTQFLFWDAVYALVVFVTLLGIGKEPVVLWTFEGGGGEGH